MGTEKKRCFVVMGFGMKTDMATGRKLNLDKSYQALIKPVVEAKGIQCVRADEIRHAGPIELQMYKELLLADLVIADLSTSNVNAFYELGIRHALKPRTTIIISEELFVNPFDVNHISISKYVHLGENIDYFEVMRFQKLLGETIDSVMANEKWIDSPVYTFLDDLTPPFINEQISQAAQNAAKTSPTPADVSKQTLSYMIEKAELALKAKQFEKAKFFFETALCPSSDDPSATPPPCSNDPYLVQRLALCTYKTRDPDPVSALNAALELLKKIDLDRTNDPETVALAGSIEKHLFEERQGNQHIDNAIQYYQRGYYLLHNRHNGINLAYLLSLRATTELDPTRDEKIADIVWARRIRQEVLDLSKRDSDALSSMKNLNGAATKTVRDEQKSLTNEQKFWIAANKAEAYFGLGNEAEFKNAMKEAADIPHEEWMMESFTLQLGKLKELLETLKGMVMAETVSA